jgi:hypothetical protein
MEPFCVYPIVNLRFGEWHFQIHRRFPWVRVTHNSYHRKLRQEPGWRWFESYPDEGTE